MTETPENIAVTAAAIAAAMGASSALVSAQESALGSDTTSDVERGPDDQALSSTGQALEPGGIEEPPDAVVHPYNPSESPATANLPGSSPIQPAPDPNNTGANQAP